MNKGVCLPGTSEDSIESSLVSTITTPEHRLPKGDKYRQTEKNTINAMHNMMHAMTWQYAVVWANATSSKLNGVGLNQRFKFKLHMWKFKCHLHDLS